jgi:hypothetical protein
MVSHTVAVCVCPAPCPVMVSGYLPAVAEALTAVFSVIVPVPGAATEFLERDAVTPLGAADRARVRAEVKPLCDVIVIVTGDEVDLFKMRFVLLGVITKVGAPITRGRLMVAVCPPPVAVTTTL